MRCQLQSTQDQWDSPASFQLCSRRDSCSAVSEIPGMLVRTLIYVANKLHLSATDCKLGAQFNCKKMLRAGKLASRYIV